MKSSLEILDRDAKCTRAEGDCDLENKGIISGSPKGSRARGRSLRKDSPIGECERFIIFSFTSIAVDDLSFPPRLNNHL
jgi:hypothetical protein